ncbi:MAG TPA: DinB family protein [Pyrinomonadaceae bacterium]|nr:DinB family protein [Pyrinomonadaceae bacterium]
MEEEKESIDAQVLRDLWGHHWWSFEKFLDEVRSLSDEEFRRDLGLSFNSVHGIVAHMVGVELLWLKRVEEGESMTLIPGVNELPNLVLIEKGWEQAQSSWRALLESDDLKREVHYSNTKGQKFSDPLWRLMAHLVDHSTAYRGILIAALRLLGRTPPVTGLIFYVRQK